MKTSLSIKRGVCFVILAALMLITAHRLPAPIVEETPTPAPVVPAKAPPPSSILTATPRPLASAPVSRLTTEGTGNPTPSVKPIGHRTRAKEQKKSIANQEERTSAVQPQKLQQSPGQSVFDGTWKGSINLVPARNWHGTGRLIGTFNVELTIEGDGAAITEHCRNSTVTLRCHRDGKMLRWDSAVFKDVSCSLMPMSDGRTALVMFRNDFYGEPTATFERTVPTP